MLQADPFLQRMAPDLQQGCRPAVSAAICSISRHALAVVIERHARQIEMPGLVFCCHRRRNERRRSTRYPAAAPAVAPHRPAAPLAGRRPAMGKPGSTSCKRRRTDQRALRQRQRRAGQQPASACPPNRQVDQASFAAFTVEIPGFGGRIRGSRLSQQLRQQFVTSNRLPVQLPLRVAPFDAAAAPAVPVQCAKLCCSKTAAFQQ